MAIVGTSDIADLKRRTTKEPPSNAGRDRFGYGRRIPTRYEVQLANETQWRRVYVCCISNTSTAYVEIPNPADKRRKKNWHVIEGSLYQ